MFRNSSFRDFQGKEKKRKMKNKQTNKKTNIQSITDIKQGKESQLEQKNDTSG